MTTSTRLQQYLLRRYPSTSEHRDSIRESVTSTCDRFVALGLADPDFATELSSGSEARFWQRYTEAALATQAVDAGLNVQSAREGPDLCIQTEHQRVWVEFICPEPNGIPLDWLGHGTSGGVVGFPYTEILLRWTAAIKEKAEKLLGNARRPGYLAKGVVAPSDAYVIAVNGRQLRGAFATLHGISQFPFAVEAVFGVGPYQLHIDRKTLDVVDRDYQRRLSVPKPSGAEVPAHTFLDERFDHVSAIWATDFDECAVVGNAKQLAVVHNPRAVNPLPLGLLPAQHEYVAKLVSQDEHLLERLPGSLT